MAEYIFQHLDNEPIFTTKANSIMDALDAFYDTGLQALLPFVGNDAGVIVDRATLSFGDVDRAYVHLITRGSPLLDGYDPLNDLPLTTRFYITGITEEDKGVTTVLPWETTLPDGFDPLAGEDGPERKGQGPSNMPEGMGGKLGMFLALAAECMAHYGTAVYEPAARIDPMRDMASICDNPQRYLSILLLKVLGSRPAKNKATDAIIHKMYQLLFELANITPDQAKDQEREVRYYRYMTSNYFYRVNQITALEHYRTEKRLSFAQLAAKTGISDRQIRNYERTPYSMLPNVKYGALTALAKALDVPADALLRNGRAVMREGKSVLCDEEEG